MLKKGVSGILSFFLLLTVLNAPTVHAEEHSISSEPSLTYTSNIKGDQRRVLFNDNWKFHYGDQNNAEKEQFDDSGWRDVQLPHDYSLELPYSKQGEAESGYKLGGTAWYRKSFTLSPTAQDKHVVVEFGGVYMNASVYINGHKLGDHPNGYTPFAYDLSPYLKEGENVLAVRVDHKFPSSRWYSGSGIYRNVHLTITDAVHVDHYGTQIVAPKLEEQQSGKVDLEVKTRILNSSDEKASIVLRQNLREKGQEAVIDTVESELMTIDAKAKHEETMHLSVQKPKLWSVENPHLYEVVTEVIADETVIDTYVTDYGFRYFDFDANTGFSLNGEKMKLKGVSMHSDQGSLGAAAHTRAMERQVEILKEMGVNAIRVTHNPAADEFIEIANRKGMLVIDEAFDTWVSSKNGNYNDYAVWFNKKVGDNPILGSKAEMTWAELDTRTMVRRGVNAPAIISWSVGNEVMEGNSGPYADYPNILEQLVQWVVDEDTTRPATIGDNKFKANWNESKKFGEVLTKYQGTVGMNYSDGSHFDAYHKNYPDWALYGAETASSINSRGVYKPSNYDRHLTSYDESTVGWGKLSADSWYSIVTRDFMAGEFVWTGFDYLGEPTPYNNVGPGATGAWPSPKSSFFGIVDTAGFPKDRYYFYQSQWNEDVDTLHILPAWKEDMVQIDKDGKVRVDVYSDAAAVELFFENSSGERQSLGKKEFTQYTTEAGYRYQVYEGEDKHSRDFKNLYLTWNVPYEDGTISAVAYDEKGQVIQDTVGRNFVTTFGDASQLSMAADRTKIIANGRDLSYITIDVRDDKGNIVEDANNLIKVRVEGDGELIALDNGDQLDHEPYDSGQRKAFNGKLLAIVKSTQEAGSFTVHLESEGLESETITVNTLEDPEQSEEKQVVAYEMPKTYYAKRGFKPNLVQEATVHFNDQSSENHKIAWLLDEHDFDEIGMKKVYGKIEALDLLVSANVTVIENVGALLNYSTAVPVGTESVNLPSTRPIVLENGEVLDVEFPVQWEAQDRANYQKEGQVTIKGKAEVFGQVHEVTANVRVAEADVKVGANVASNYLTLTQSIPKEYQSDNLLAIVDGDTSFKVVDGGRNDSVWTNYNMAQTGQNEAEIIFTFATAQYLGSVDLHFYQDAWATRLPKDVEMYWSNEGTEDATWSPIDFVETKGETSPGVPNTSKVNYRFDGVPAVGFKIVLRSEEGSNPQGKKLAVGLTEAALHVVNSDLIVHEDAKLDQLAINGYEVSQADLDRKDIYTEYQKATIVAQSESNASVTILDVHEDIIHIITESEDHTEREHYRVHLNQEGAIQLPADDASKDYPYAKTTATAGDHHPNHPSEGHPSFAVDNDGSTIFHTPWKGTDPSNFWITLELEEVSKIEALRYQSRGGSPNGIVHEYKVECSMDNENWELVSEGKWGSEMNQWSLASFDEPRECKFVRLSALSTYGEGAQANKFMSAKEIRLRMADEKVDISEAEFEIDPKEYLYTGEAIKPNLVVSYEGQKLEEGVDYRLQYQDNVEVGTAKVIVTGIAHYEGQKELEFVIQEAISLDDEALLAKIEAAKGISSDDYTEESYALLREAILAAEKALDEAKDQATLDAALKDLEKAIDALVEAVKTEQLMLILDFVEGLDSKAYTEESFAKVMEIVETAQALLEKDSTQAEIDEAVSHLEEALKALEKKEDALQTEALEAKIMVLSKLDAKKYSEESFLKLQKVLEEAEKILETAEDQEAIDAALEKLLEAEKALESKKPVEPEEKPTEPEEKPTEPEEKPVEPEEKPTEPEEKPVEPEEKPTEPEEKPTESEEKPTESEEKPTESEEKPTEPEEKPTEPEEKPTEPKEKPTEPEEKPTETEEKPTESEEKPEEKPVETDESGNAEEITEEKLPATGVSAGYAASMIILILGTYLYIKQYYSRLKD